MTISREEFLARRKAGIGGSDIAAIVGLSPWATPRSVWLDKKGMTEPEPETEAMYWGTTLEDIVAQEYAKRTGRKIMRCNSQFTDPEYPFLVGNIDRAVFDEAGKIPVYHGEYRSTRGLECKTASQYAANEWGETGTGQIPEQYKCQVQWYMMLTGAEVWDVAVLIGNRDFRIYTIYRDEVGIAYLRREGVQFWREYVEKDIMPPAENMDDVESLRKGEPKARKFADEELTQMIEDYRALDERIKNYAAEQDALKVAICDRIGDAEELTTIDGRKLCSWSAAKMTSKTDWKAVAKAMNPPDDIIAKYTTEALSARRFTLAKK